MRFTRLLLAGAVAFSLAACEDPQTTSVQDSIDSAGFFARFSPSDSVIPFPNNVLFGTVTLPDVTLDIPVPALDTTTCPNAGEIAVKTALNDLDGFSTTAPISTTFSSAIDTTSLVVGNTVRIFEVTLTGGAVSAINRELDSTEVAVGRSGVDNQIQDANCDTESLGANKLVIVPLKPLTPKTSYLVVLTKDIKGANGNNAVADTVYAFTKSTTPLTTTFPVAPTQLTEVSYSGLLAPADLDGSGAIDTAAEQTAALAMLPSIGDLDLLRAATVASEAAVENYTVTADAGGTIADTTASNIILSWTFTTQSTSDVLDVIRASVDGGAVPASALADTTVDSPLGAASIYAGTLTTTYYLNSAANEHDPAPLSGSWQSGGQPLTWFTSLSNTLPDGVSKTIPLLATIPNTGSGPWKVVIFQHGITRNRTDMLAVADSLAQAGFAVVAIDLPLHGLTGTETDGTEAFYSASIERTFNLDLVNNTTMAAGFDGNIDPSGQHYINLTSLLTSRDNVRQSVADLYVLRKALEGMNAGGNTFDTSNIYFVGHSMGGIAGTVFLATEPTVKSAVLPMTGGGIAKLLDGSASFGPLIAAGLAANGVNKGYAQYEEFMASAQMALDSADPINYGEAAATGRGMLQFEVIGDGANNLPDQTIPNNVLNLTGTVNAPLSGTDPLLYVMGLSQISASDTAANLGVSHIGGYVRFTGGHHGSILTPNDASGNADPTSAAVTVEMQSEMAEFLTYDGAQITVTNTTVVDVP